MSGMLFSSSSLSKKDIVEHFEWGEYDTLESILQPYLDSIKGKVDSTETAQYYSYLAVAKFSKGMIGKARELFYNALLYDQTVMLDSAYISPEMQNLFIATKIEFYQQKQQIRHQDSLLTAKQMDFEQNLEKIKSETLMKRKKNLSILSIAVTGISALFVGVVVYEYCINKDSYHEFKAAAETGNQLDYDHYRTIVRRANNIIIGCEISGSVSLLSGLFLSIKARMINNEITGKQ